MSAWGSLDETYCHPIDLALLAGSLSNLQIINMRFLLRQYLK